MIAHVLLASLAVAAGDDCTPLQLTLTSAHDVQDIDANVADGTRIAFQSRMNLTGQNPDLSFELFLLDTTTGMFTQLTDNPGSEFPRGPAIDAAGVRVAYQSRLDPTGQNPDGNEEIFLYDSGDGSTTQLTQTIGGFNLLPAIDAAGSLVAFYSNRDLAGQNADGSLEIFTVEVATLNYEQVTDAVSGNSERPQVSADGTRIVFGSTSNLAGNNPDGNLEIFLADTVAGTKTQITDSLGGQCTHQRISHDGMTIAFACDTEPAGGTNPNGNYEVFLYDVPSAKLTQLTDTSTTLHSFPSSISTAGEQLAFWSPLDVTGGNPDGNTEIFLYEPATNGYLQVTDSVGASSFHPHLTDGVNRIVFDSDGDFAGTNPEGNREVFAMEACPSPGVPASEVVRLGTPPNPNAFVPGITIGPVLGATWNPLIDHTTFVPSSILDVIVIGFVPINVPSGFGTILCGVPPLLPLTVVTGAPGLPFALPIPANPAHAGTMLCTQGASIDAGLTIALTNALDITLGTF